VKFIPLNLTFPVEPWFIIHRVTFLSSLKLNAGDEDVNDHDEININEICDNPVYDEILNGKITEAIRKLKNNKAPGTDNILNEYTIVIRLNIILCIFYSLHSVQDDVL
jgi:hypothetical protein